MDDLRKARGSPFYKRGAYQEGLELVGEENDPSLSPSLALALFGCKISPQCAFWGNGSRESVGMQQPGIDATAAQRATADGKPTLNRPQPELGGRLRVSQRRERYINRNMYLLSRVGCRQSFTGTNMLDGAAVTYRTSTFKRRYLESTRSWLRPSGSTSAGSGEAVAGVACISSYVTASTAGNTAVGSLKVRNRPTFARSFTARSTKPPPSTTNGSKWSGGAPTLVGAALLFAGAFFGAQLLNGAGPSSDNVST